MTRHRDGRKNKLRGDVSYYCKRLSDTEKEEKGVYHGQVCCRKQTHPETCQTGDETCLLYEFGDFQAIPISVYLKIVVSYIHVRPTGAKQKKVLTQTG
jgi:hypothetical protein